MSDMTKEQAWQLIAQALPQLQITLQQHKLLADALLLLKPETKSV